MLSDMLLDQFAHQFYGYGSYTGRFWFIGMEEGGDTEGEVQRRLQAWEARGSHELEDLAGYHRALGIDRHFSAVPALQSTWAKLIRMVLSADGQTPNKDRVRAYQRDEWGRRNSDTCLIELFPLPSPSLGSWLYGACSSLPYLRSREEYRASVASRRIEHIQKRIAEHQPHAVIFYGLQYRDWWESITEVPFEARNAAGVLMAHKGTTRYLMVPHPVAFGATNAYFEQAGKLIGLAFP